MPKLIDYPRTNYTGAWELAEITDDTGGKCAIETAARKLDRKVSGSFKAIIGSAVKFGLVTSKRDLLTTTTLFKRIKHAYDKQEELIFHREAFLTPPLFTQLCRKFRSRELPIQMLDIMLIREFNVEEINAPGVAKAFVEGCRMVGLLDEHNIIADIDALASKQPPRRELASPQPSVNTFRHEYPLLGKVENNTTGDYFQLMSDDSGKSGNSETETESPNQSVEISIGPVSAPVHTDERDAIASLFDLLGDAPKTEARKFEHNKSEITSDYINDIQKDISKKIVQEIPALSQKKSVMNPSNAYQIQVSGPGVNTSLNITEVEDIDLAVAVLEKIRRQLKSQKAE